jgi:integrase
LKHPFLFVTGRGSPMSPAKFQKLHEAAIRRIGLEPAKRFGTTPHGHRHAYAQALRRSGLSPEYRRIALHHVSLESQAAYSQPSPEEVQSALHAADGHCQGLPSWGKI